MHLEEKRTKDKQEKAVIIFGRNALLRKWEKGREDWGNEGNGKRKRGRENKGWERGEKGEDEKEKRQKM